MCADENCQHSNKINPVIVNKQFSSIMGELMRTTIEPEIQLGDDVLTEKSDGKFYVGTVESITVFAYTIRFDDGTLEQCPKDAVQKLCNPVDPEEFPACYICQIRDDSVKLCIKCGNQYHDACSPDVNSSSYDDSACRDCQIIVIPSDTDEDDIQILEVQAEPAQRVARPKQIFRNKSDLPYEVSISITFRIHKITKFPHILD